MVRVVVKVMLQRPLKEKNNPLRAFVLLPPRVETEDIRTPFSLRELAQVMNDAEPEDA